MDSSNLHLNTTAISRYGIKDRVAVVSGASGLIGKAICHDLAALGVKIVAGYNENQAAAEKLMLEITDMGGICEIVQADLSESSGPEMLRNKAMKTFRKIDMVLAVAGVKPRSLAMMTSATDLRKTVNINIESQIALSRMSLRAMSASGWGRIVFIGSRAGSVGLPGQAAYASTKGALSAWAASVAGEVGKKGITVNVVAPGAIDDAEDKVYSPEEQEKVCDRIGVGRLGNAGEVASVVSFLCSANASYINGATIAVDGGARF